MCFGYGLFGTVPRVVPLLGFFLGRPSALPQEWYWRFGLNVCNEKSRVVMRGFEWLSVSLLVVVSGSVIKWVFSISVTQS